MQLFTLFYTDAVPWALVFKGCPIFVFVFVDFVFNLCVDLFLFGPFVLCLERFFFVSFTVFLEHTSSISGVSFGRTDLSIGGICATVHALLHRRGSVGPSF